MTAPLTERRIFIIDAAEQLDDDSRSPDELAHYVDQRIDQDVTSAMINGAEVVALCGHRWVPSRDPRKLPVCVPCVDALAAILGGRA